MKKIKLSLLFVISTLAVSSCGINLSPKKDEQPPEEPFNFERTHYEYLDTQAEYEVEGAPWINTNVSSYIDRIDQPSIKDDFYAHVNYEDMTSGGQSLFDSSAQIASANLANIFNGSANYTDKNVVSYLMNNISLTTDYDVINYIKNIDCEEFLSTKEALTLPSSPLRFINRDKHYLYFDYGVDVNLPLLSMYAYYSTYDSDYDYYKYIATELYETLFGILGYSYSTTKVEFVIQIIGSFYFSAYQYSESYGATETTVGELDNEIIKAALYDYGFDDDFSFTYLNSAGVYLNDLMEHSYFEEIIKTNLLFDYRFLIGAESYNQISQTLKNLYFFENDFVINGLDETTIKKNFIKALIPVVINKGYIDCYKDDELKANIANTIAEVIVGYKDLVTNSKWMNTACKSVFKKKLNKVRTSALYSDALAQAAPLNLNTSSISNLIEICNAYSKYITQLELDNVLTNTDSNESYVVNAFYQAYTNSFVILLGLVADPNWYSSQKELLYARVAFVIAHEMSHGFDPNCIVYNENGKEVKMWGDSDARKTYNSRVRKMINFYNKIHYFDDVTIDGDLVKGEAFADLGAMSVVLNMAKKIDNFDYDVFFKEYAKTWLDVYPIQTVEYYLNDTHPLSYIRCNSVVCQFQEFADTYDIRPGDGMYMPKSGRVAVLTD